MKTAKKIAFGLTFACLACAVGSAQAQMGGGPMPGGVGMINSSDSMPGMTGMAPGYNPMPGASGMVYPGSGTMPGGSVSGGGYYQQQPMMSPGNVMGINPAVIANTYGVGGMQPQGGGGTSPMLDLRQVVWGGMQGLPQDQRYNGAMNMAGQNIYQLQQNMGSGSSPINQIRNAVRDSIMTSRVSDISRMGQSTFRPMIQPGAVQSMISQIQPWNFPIRFQSAMMPAMIPTVSAPIKQIQMQFMQSGIMNNGFPNVPLPAPAFGQSPYYGGNGSGGMMPGMPNGGMWGGGGIPGGPGMNGGGGFPGMQQQQW